MIGIKLEINIEKILFSMEISKDYERYEHDRKKERKLTKKNIGLKID